MWKDQVEPALAAILGDARETIQAAIASGWTPWQALELLREWHARQVSDGDGRVLRAWKPGAVWWQLRHGAPGSPITMPEDPRYRSERASQQRRRELIRSVPTAGEVPRDEALAALETACGPALDSLTHEQVKELAFSVSPFAGRRFLSAGLTPALRSMLLARLSQRQQQEVDT